MRKGDDLDLRSIIVHAGGKTGPSNLVMFQTIKRLKITIARWILKFP
jgi:hypothetical protein